MNTTLKALSGWRSYRKFMQSQEGPVEDKSFLNTLPLYYQNRIEEAPFDAAVVFFIVVAAILMGIIAILVR